MNKSAFVLAMVLGVAASGSVLAQQKMDDMKGMDMAKKPAAGASATHQTKATVKKVDATAGTVTLAHEPVPTLNWPSMTMAFKVKEKKLMDKFSDGKSVEIEFVKEGKDYVVKSVK
jgi:Cu(I)/Ag(I) efflux system protein CusF